MRVLVTRISFVFLISAILSGCGAEALYYGMQAAGALEAAGAAASIANDISEEKKAEAERYYQQAVAFAKQGQLTQAEEWIQKAIKTNPNRLQYRSYLGLIYSRMAELKEDPSYYRKTNEQYLFCLKRDAKNTALMNAIAWHDFLLNENLDDGIAYIKKAIKLDGRNPFFIGTYGCLMMQKGNYDRAVELLEEASDKHLAAGRKKVAAIDLYHLSLTQFRMGNKEKAKETLQKATQLDPHCKYRKKTEQEVTGI